MIDLEPTAERPVQRYQLDFPSGRERCAGWWYVPDGARSSPFLVMAHGMGATRELGLDAFARRFCAAGLCVLAFDYRHYGQSSGEPRELLSISRQLADYRAALAFARQRPEVDAQRAALWGVSFSGGHVMALSSEPLGVRAVIAQQPFCSGARASGSVSAAYVRRTLAPALRDVSAAVLRRAPVYIPLFAGADELALMANDECVRGYPELVPDEVAQSGRWRNRVAARICLSVPWYEPGRELAKPGPPVLVIAGQRDTLAPAAFIAAAVKGSKRARLLTYPGGHFDYVRGQGFEQAVSDQLQFLREHLSRESVANGTTGAAQPMRPRLVAAHNLRGSRP